MRSPLRSKRAMISPVRPRAKASGLTRMRVRSTAGRMPDSARGRRFGDRRRLLRRLGRAPAAGARSLGWADLGLAVGTHAPSLLQRLAAGGAGLLEPAHAARALQEVALDLGVAVGAELEARGVQPGLGGLHLELALADVL